MKKMTQKKMMTPKMKPKKKILAMKKMKKMTMKKMKKTMKKRLKNYHSMNSNHKFLTKHQRPNPRIISNQSPLLNQRS